MAKFIGLSTSGFQVSTLRDLLQTTLTFLRKETMMRSVINIFNYKRTKFKFFIVWVYFHCYDMWPFTFLHLYEEIIGFLMWRINKTVSLFKWPYSSLSVGSAQWLCEAVSHCTWTYMERRALLTSQKLCFGAKSTQQGAGHYRSLSYIFPVF